MAKQDLVDFFKAEVPAAQAGDDQISKFVGVPYQEGGSPEADLDTQFIMGSTLRGVEVRPRPK